MPPDANFDLEFGIFLRISKACTKLKTYAKRINAFATEFDQFGGLGPKKWAKTFLGSKRASKHGEICHGPKRTLEITFFRVSDFLCVNMTINYHSKP